MRFIGDLNDLYKAILIIIRDSNKFLYIVSPYIGFEKDNSSIKAFKVAFNDALNRFVKVCIITRGGDPRAPKDNIYKIKDFLEYQGHIYLVPYLHSKIYCNERCALITSLNLSISSLFNQNEESGILLECYNSLESKIYKQIISYVDYLKNIER